MAGDRQTRNGSPHQQSVNVRNLLHEEEFRGGADASASRDDIRDASTVRNRWSPRRSPRRLPKNGQKGGERDGQPAGLHQSRTATAGLTSAEGGTITCSSVKEAQMEADCLQLRDGVAAGVGSPRSPRVQDPAAAPPMIGDLAPHEIRHMGRAVAEANLRLREQFHQAPAPGPRPRSPMRSSLKKTKGAPMAARGGSSSHAGPAHERIAGRRPASSNATSGTVTPTGPPPSAVAATPRGPDPRGPDPASMPQAALCALRAELVQRQSSGTPATATPASAGSLEAPVAATPASAAVSSLDFTIVNSGMHDGAVSDTPIRINSAANKARSPSSGPLREAELKEAIHMADGRITELRAAIEQLRSKRGESYDPALRERSAAIERAPAPPQVQRMYTPVSQRSSAPPAVTRTPLRQNSDESVVIAVASRPEIDQRRAPEAATRVRFDERHGAIETPIPLEEKGEESAEFANQAEVEQTCWRRWESPKPTPGMPLTPGKPLAAYPLTCHLNSGPEAPMAPHVPVPAIAANIGSAGGHAEEKLRPAAASSAPSDSDTKKSKEAIIAGMEATLEAELEDVKRRHAEALEAELERVRQQHQAKKAAKKSPRTSLGGA